MLRGKIIRMDSGNFGFEYVTTESGNPRQIRQVWELPEWRTSGMSWCEDKDAIGRDASITDGKVSCYLGNGNYFTANLPQGGATQSTLCEVTEIPPPKVRPGIETRWNNGQWQKLLKAGWKAA